MKKFILAVVFCMAMVSMAYGQTVTDITSSVKNRATGVAKQQAAALTDDASITAETKLKLSTAASLKTAKIEVSTTEGVVTLRGSVQTKQAKGAATKMTRAVKGVKSVENQLTIEPLGKKAAKPAAKK